MGMVAHAEWSSRCRRSLASLGAESAMESLRMRRGKGEEEEEEEKERRSERRGEKRRRGSWDLWLSLSLSHCWMQKEEGKNRQTKNKKKDMHVELRVKIVAIKENHRGLCKRIRFWSDDWAVKCVSRQLPVLAHHTRPCKVRRKTADQTTREGDGER